MQRRARFRRHTVMRIRRLVTASAALALVAGLAAATPSTAVSDTTAVTFSLLSGNLSIDAPLSASGSANAGSPVVNATVANTQITDDTGLLGGWSVTASATELVGWKTDDSAVNGTKLACSKLVWVTDSLTALASSNAILDGVTVGAGGTFDDPLTAASCDPVAVATAVSLFGGGSYEYDGLLTLTVPANTPAGHYKTVITQTLV